MAMAIKRRSNPVKKTVNEPSGLDGIPFKLERDTKGAVVYKEVDSKGRVLKEGYVVGTLYVRKDALPEGDTPEKITVSISF